MTSLSRPSAATLNDPDLPPVSPARRASRELAGSRSPAGSTTSSRRHRDLSPRRRDSRDYSPRRRDSRDRSTRDHRDREPRGRDRDHDRRSRSRSPPRRRSDDRHRDDRRDDRRGRDYDYDRRRRSPSPDRRRRSQSPDRRRRTSPAYNPVEKAQALAKEPRRSPTPDLTEEQHEMRSVFVAQLAARVDDRALKAFFELRCGKVTEAKVITDRISRRSKGVGYVEFADIEAVPKALALTGTVLLGIPVFVQLTESEKNRRAAAANSSAMTNANVQIGEGSDARPEAQIPYNRIYVGSLNFNLTDADIKQVFQPFGPVDFVEIHRDPETGKSKGYGYVQFNQHADAKSALGKMQGFELAGRPVQLKTGLTHIGSQMKQVPRKDEPTRASRDDREPRSYDRDRARDMADRADRRDRVQANDLDDADYTSHISRLDLMQRLARTDIPVTAPTVAAPTYRVNIPTARSEYIRLLNLFDSREETEPNWDKDLRDDVKAECEAKYGAVADIHLDRDSTEGEILVKFKSVDDAEKAIDGLNGRFFGGRQIQASYMTSALFQVQTGRK